MFPFIPHTECFAGHCRYHPQSRVEAAKESWQGASAGRGVPLQCVESAASKAASSQLKTQAGVPERRPGCTWGSLGGKAQPLRAQGPRWDPEQLKEQSVHGSRRWPRRWGMVRLHVPGGPGAPSRSADEQTAVFQTVGKVPGMPQATWPARSSGIPGGLFPWWWACVQVRGGGSTGWPLTREAGFSRAE